LFDQLGIKYATPSDGGTASTIH